MDFAIPQSKIAGLSSGEFVGMVADDPLQKIKLKTFHCEILNDHEQLQRENSLLKPLPVLKELNQKMINENYYEIKNEVANIIESEIGILMNSPGKELKMTNTI
jgi:hypothetical protein